MNTFLVVIGFLFGALQLTGSTSTPKLSGTYKVFRIVPHDEKQLKVLAQLYRDAADYQLDFWKAPKGIDNFVDVMVPPTMLDTLPPILLAGGLTYTITINDVQKLIEDHEHNPSDSIEHDEKGKNDSKPNVGSFFRRIKDDEGLATGRKPYYNFSEYGSYNQMVYYMEIVAYYNPAIARMVKLGTTHDGQVIQGMKIGNPSSETDKRVIWIDGGIHAREWASMHTALFFINELVSKYGNDDEITHYVNSLNFYIFPCLNPDGYEFTRASADPQTRLWRKNRSPEICTVNRWQQSSCCRGVDLNRNFDFHWSESGSSDDPCSSIYQGKEAFSEPEARAVRDLILSPELDGKVDAFITMHTYAQIWIHPFSHQPKSYPYDINDLQRVGKKAVESLQSLYGTRYQLGTGAETLSPASGGSDDWAKDKAKIKFVYLLELRPEENRWNGFILNKRELIPTARETWAGVKVVVDEVLEEKGLSRKTSETTTETTAETTTQNTTESPRPENSTTETLKPETQTPPTFFRRWTTGRFHARRTTTRSPGAEACKDLRYSCGKWLVRAPLLCSASEAFMREQCPKSCGYC